MAIEERVCKNCEAEYTVTQDQVYINTKDRNYDEDVLVGSGIESNPVIKRIFEKDRCPLCASRHTQKIHPRIDQRDT